MAKKRGRGRPPTYDPTRMLPVVRAMAKLGATDVELAAALKVSVGAIELWARTHPEFLRAVKPAKRAADERVERSLFKRATGYSYDSEELVVYDHLVEVKHEEDGKPIFVKEKRVFREPVVKHVPPDTVAAIFWLKNRRKERWRDFKATEISTPPGRPFEVTASAPGESELIGAYYKRLSQAGIDAAATAAGATDGTYPGVDPGMGERGQGPNGQGGDPPAGKD